MAVSRHTLGKLLKVSSLKLQSQFRLPRKDEIVSWLKAFE